MAIKDIISILAIASIPVMFTWFLISLLSLDRPSVHKDTILSNGVFFDTESHGTVYEDGSYTVITKHEVITGCIPGAPCND